MSQSKDKPLKAHVTQSGVLVIEIGVATLAFAALRSPFAYELADDPREPMPHERFRITNAHGFAKEVVTEMLAESEDGTTMLDLMLDKACERAIEQGSQFFEDSKEKD